MHHPFTTLPTVNSEKAITLALSLAQAENAINAFTSGQVDAILDSDGNTYLLRPAQQRLRQKEKHMEAVMDAAPDVITVIDRGGVILSQSHAVSRVLGYIANELVGSKFFERVHQDDLSAAYFAFFDVIEGFSENTTAQFRHLARDGSWCEVEATVGRLDDGDAKCVVFNLRNHPAISSRAESIAFLQFHRTGA